ncbi:hypothetical protein FFK22_024505 [Mycobacterium sp. KBS0706]|uniref:hypothetical protein n=1 Tax=Mycobacterium sp. KBS0706 TaxID=2578109 RepID=UPI00110F9D89|nr:hypothetical protein [Mycobacterium sp. KBS0706]TSD85986.1 hypothetical protein FFK22_024505 [Mycobacterium sp. KBS0706]
MNKTQTDQTSEVPPNPQEERAADLCVLAELVEIQMSIARATQQEALQAPQPGVDYSQRIATISRAVRLTLLLKGKLSQEDKEKRKTAAKREAAQEDFHDLRVKLALMAAAYEASKDNAEIARRVAEVREQLERPEVAELIEASRAPVAVAALCRRWGLPVRVERWLEMADEAMEQLGFLPDDDDPPADPPKPDSASGRRRKPRPSDTG